MAMPNFYGCLSCHALICAVGETLAAAISFQTYLDHLADKPEIEGAGRTGGNKRTANAAIRERRAQSMFDHHSCEHKEEQVEAVEAIRSRPVHGRNKGGYDQ